jgi:uncharacterized protein YbaA (DUF1428 family)
MNYIDGFAFAVPTAKREAFRKMAELSALIFKEYGALRVVECWGDDVPPGKLTSFPMAVKCEADEVVVFVWVEWLSKQVRDESMKKINADEPMKHVTMPFDGKRMIFGGFQAIVDKS